MEGVGLLIKRRVGDIDEGSRVVDIEEGGGC